MGDAVSPDEVLKITQNNVSGSPNDPYTYTPAPELLQDRDIKPVAGELQPLRMHVPMAGEEHLECQHSLNRILMCYLTALWLSSGTA